MFSLFKKKHKHTWELIACNDKYATTYPDGRPDTFWHQRFYRCSCGERTHTHNIPRNRYIVHSGIEKAKQNWLEAGVVPDNSYFPDETSGYIKPQNPGHADIDPVLQYKKTLDELVNSLGVVINRDFDLEAKYPELKKAADEYHRRLSKYRTAEILKGESNDA